MCAFVCIKAKRRHGRLPAKEKGAGEEQILPLITFNNQTRRLTGGRADESVCVGYPVY